MRCVVSRNKWPKESSDPRESIEFERIEWIDEIDQLEKIPTAHCVLPLRTFLLLSRMSLAVLLR